VSDDQGAGAPSFGALFDDPDAPVAPVGSPPAAPTAPSAPAAPTPDPIAVPVPAPAHPTPGAPDDLVTGHDLDHESDEAAHLVAGFESLDDPADADLVEAPPVEAPPVEVAPAETPVPTDVVAPAAGAVSVAAASSWDGTVDRAVSSAPASRVDTGRLYRSAGAEGPATLDAIPAIDADHAPLGTVRATEYAAGRTGSGAAEAAVPLGTGTVGLTYSGVMVVVVAATVLVGFVEALLRNELGWITGLALLVSSVYAAVFVRHADIWAAVVAPPLAFLAATLTAGQLTLGATGSLLEREGFMIFKSLAVNAPWILATTVICLAIVLIRRRRNAASLGAA
jgi:hypothetical protein